VPPVLSRRLPSSLEVLGQKSPPDQRASCSPLRLPSYLEVLLFFHFSMAVEGPLFAIVTPFAESDLSLDEAALRASLQFLIDKVLLPFCCKRVLLLSRKATNI